ncbi:MAG: helix-turn-helix domain-containing protein [Gammaproteobacteria bacterium]|nr:helix-turn-helix domain-containing protein [Gammaproteobacteria bacterium]MBU1655055.1 helix-turn-helix domain-containing protein [Gammaproteobacteria bacterium]MBU1961754.1 helix-turn-helix domain-containing protein [Gammaproteobacteria bacterium]
MSNNTADPLDIHLGIRLRRLRNRRGFSMERVAELIEVSQQQISRFELGKNRLSAAQLFRLARGLNVPVYWFFEGFEENAEELGRVRNVARETRDGWQASADEDLAQALLSHWRALPNDRQRRKVVELVETLTAI